MKKKLEITMMLVLCILLTGCGSKTDNIYSVLEENNYKIFYNFSYYNGNYYDLEKSIYDSSYEESDFVREVLDENTPARIDIVNMDTVDNLYEEVFRFMPDAAIETKYYYEDYVDGTSYSYWWNADSTEAYVDVNSCRYYIKGSGNSEKCTDENAELAQEFYNDYYLATLEQLNLTEEELVNLFDEITTNYIEPHKKELIKNDKGITYREFLVNIDNSNSYNITKLSEGVVISEESISPEIPTMHNMYVLFEGNKVDALFLEYWERLYIIYDNTIDKYRIMMGDTNCLYDVETSSYSGECSESDMEELDWGSNGCDREYLLFTSNFRVTKEEFINFIERYYNDN